MTDSVLDVVLDTNVVLDWLVFGDPVAASLEAAFAAGRFRWIRTGPMRDELARVVPRDAFARWRPDASAVLGRYDALAHEQPVPTPLPAHEHLRCADPDDQPFIDLAIARRAHALLTHDRALLRLARRARAFGVLVATPQSWLAGPAPATTAESAAR